VPVGVKLNSSDFQRGGFDERESMAVVDALRGAGVDFLEISGGTFESPAMTGAAAARASTQEREAYFLHYAERVRERSRIPLMLTGGLRSARAMERLVSDGAVDVCGLARPLAREPNLPLRLQIDPDATSIATPLMPRRRSLAPAAETLWHTAQIRRLAHGREPSRVGALMPGLVRYAAATTCEGLLRPLVNAWPRPAEES
jgi:2,4-dienoyl-CoA reductase-like NADH-dependent reductase (Old Yellow Enzyme family)